ncbi:HET-domain-containing protein [Dendrothele bispora CBS 962.96]|uniref:HET-domain-containing protein n=1 Tax=Dendrothele bispora (strain CBS 962.96) TaxID=1314807 RepID=A0A4S8M4I4_DENBC|nr:HET-domain-containing protein [Dendrothele bispora CBS 962.96]
MRLLNTKTYELEEFFVEIPLYAILSHTWDREEVTFQDIQDLEIAKYRAGWLKIERACTHARKYDFEWIWIDSCCINKESSAELSEAINSMYQYYEESEVCYVYLCDFTNSENDESAINQCRWFRRGWTLQELLAPSYVVFLDKDWTETGTKWSLCGVISAVTSIPEPVLIQGDVETYSIAQRMSWAASRETTRPEDQAYCLMGIFGVSMSPIYGEGGTKAFMRLQQEIIKYSDDRSIFAWIASSPEHAAPEERGLLARSPYEFRASGGIGVSELSDVYRDGYEPSYSFGNNGLNIHLPLTPTESGHFLAYLLCRSNGKYIAVYLRQTREQQYVRCRADELALITPGSSSLVNVRRLVVKENPNTRRTAKKTRAAMRRDHHNIAFHIRILPAARQRFFTFLQCTGATFNQTTGRVVTNALQRFNISSLKFAVYDHNNTEDLVILIRFPLLTPCFKVVTNLTSPKEGWEGQPFSRRFLSLATEDRHCHGVDRIIKPLETGGKVSLAIQMTGNQSDFRILEIDYISTIRMNTNPTMMHQPEFQRADIVLSIRVRHPQLSFQSTFPPDLYQRQWGDQTHISIPNTGNPSTSFRVITFFLRTGLSSHTTIYVPVGFQESKVWSDIVFLSSDNGSYDPDPAKEIWKSYLDSGSRMQNRTRTQSSLSVVHECPGFFFGSGTVYHKISINITKTEGTNLQLGSYVLQFEVRHYSEHPGEPVVPLTLEQHTSSGANLEPAPHQRGVLFGPRLPRPAGRKSYGPSDQVLGTTDSSSRRSRQVLDSERAIPSGSTSPTE